jgi:hypothetical protein
MAAISFAAAPRPYFGHAIYVVRTAAPRPDCDIAYSDNPAASRASVRSAQPFQRRPRPSRGPVGVRVAPRGGPRPGAPGAYFGCFFSSWPRTAPAVKPGVLCTFT